MNKLQHILAKWWARDWFRVLVLFVLTRVIIDVIGIIGAGLTNPRVYHDLLDPSRIWSIWDVEWYRKIAHFGYKGQPDPSDTPYTLGFMPLYPVFVGMIMKVVRGLDFFYIASLVSNVASYLAILWIYRYIRSRGHDANSFLWLYLFACGSFTLSIPYTESIFLLCTIAVIALSAKQKYYLAGLIAGIAFLSRIQAVALILIPLIDSLKSRKTWKQHLWLFMGIGVLFAVPIGFYMAYLKQINGDPLAFVHAQSLWGDGGPYPFRALIGLITDLRKIAPFLHMYLWAVYLLILWRNRRTMDVSHIVFCLAVFALSASTTVLFSAYRYVVPLFPIIEALTTEKQNIKNLFIYSNLILLPVYIITFVNANFLAI